MPDLDAAEQFLAAHARVLDRRRFERLFRDGPADAVRDAVAAYRTADGGFGHGLEPDGRGAGSQPAAIALALRTLDEAGAWDEALVAGACDWLERAAPPEGGTTFVDPSIVGWPRAPWWEPEPELRASTIATGPITAVLRRRGSRHPWLERADALMWAQVEHEEPSGPYGLLGMAAFLGEPPDRERAAAAVERLGDALRADTTIGPLGLAPRPDSPVRAAFGDDVIEAALDALAAGQHEDGGWSFDWPVWSPAAEADWRGSITVDALVLLRDNGR